MVNTSLNKNTLNEPQLLEGVDSDMFGKNIDTPNNSDL